MRTLTELDLRGGDEGTRGRGLESFEDKVQCVHRNKKQ